MRQPSKDHDLVERLIIGAMAVCAAGQVWAFVALVRALFS